MLDSSSRRLKIITAACGLSIVMTLTLGIALCSSSRRSQVTAIAHLAKMRLTSSTPKLPTDSLIPAPTPTTVKPAPSVVVVSPAPAAAVSKPTGTTSSSQVKVPPATVGAPTARATTIGPSAGTPSVAAATVAARRTPTAAEVNQAIKAVHQLVPFFTPTATQVARVGNQVCTAFDQGMTFAQVKSKISAMLGSLSWLVPSSVATQGVRTIVSLYCPGYASKLV